MLRADSHSAPVSAHGSWHVGHRPYCERKMEIRPAGEWLVAGPLGPSWPRFTVMAGGGQVSLKEIPGEGTRILVRIA